MIQEINPTGYTEWSDRETSTWRDQYIRLDNTTDQEIDLDGYQVRIVSGATDTTFELSGQIGERFYIRRILRSQEGDDMLVDTFATADFGNLSNTAGAFVELRDPTGRTVDSVNFLGEWPLSIDQDESLHRDGIYWQVLEHSYPASVDDGAHEEDDEGDVSEPEPTVPEDPETSPEEDSDQDQDMEDDGESDEEVLSLDQVYQLEHNDVLLTQGKVVIATDRVYARSLYITDGTRLARVLHPTDMTDLPSVGESVLISGSWLSTDTQEYIRLEEWTSTDEVFAEPDIVDFRQDDGTTPGRVLRIQGTLLSNRSQRLEVMTGDQVVPVRLPNVFEKPSMRTGQEMSIVGFVDRRREEFRLTPWQEDQIQLSQEEVSEDIQEKESAEMSPEQSAEHPLRSISGVYRSSGDDTFRVRGAVLAVPGIIFANSVYIHDGRQVVRVELPRNASVIPEIGMMIEVKGNWLRTDTQEYVRLESWERKPDTIPSLEIGSVGQVSGDQQGRFVTVTGELDVNQSSRLEILTSEGRVIVRLGSGVDKPQMRRGDTISVTGFVDRRGDEWRIQPWSATQIEPLDGLGGGEDEGSGEDGDSQEEYLLIENSDQLGDMEHDALVQLDGVIAIESGVMYANALYILADDRLVRVNHPRNDTPELSVGQKVRLKGSWHSTDTRSYLRLEEYTIHGDGQVNLSISPVNQVGPDQWGRGVQISGVLEINQASRLSVLTPAGEVMVRLPSGFNRPEGLRKGDSVQVRGFVDVYQGQARISPWMESQVVRFSAEDESESENAAADVTGTQANLMDAGAEYIPFEDYDLDLGTGGISHSVARFIEPLWNRIPAQLRENRVFLGALWLNLAWWLISGGMWLRRKYFVCS